MGFVSKLMCVVFLSTVALAAQSKPATNESEIKRALSAAPPAIAEGSAVVSMDESGKMTQLRSGTNGWTCLPHDMGTPGGQPLCLDANGLEWYHAAMTGKEPDPNKIGYSYMLQGGSVWSNTDPAATKLPQGQKDFVHVPPHFMILNAKVAASSGFPSGEATPNTHKPFVMFGGTPFALIIVPVK